METTKCKFCRPHVSNMIPFVYQGHLSLIAPRPISRLWTKHRWSQHRGLRRWSCDEFQKPPIEASRHKKKHSWSGPVYTRSEVDANCCIFPEISPSLSPSSSLYTQCRRVCQWPHEVSILPNQLIKLLTAKCLRFSSLPWAAVSRRSLFREIVKSLKKLRLLSYPHSDSSRANHISAKNNWLLEKKIISIKLILQILSATSVDEL